MAEADDDRQYLFLKTLFRGKSRLSGEWRKNRFLRVRSFSMKNIEFLVLSVLSLPRPVEQETHSTT